MKVKTRIVKQNNKYTVEDYKRYVFLKRWQVAHSLICGLEVPAIFETEKEAVEWVNKREEQSKLRKKILKIT